MKYPPNGDYSLPSKQWKVFSYRDVKVDIDGWVDAELFLPGDYDLVYMKIDGKKSVVGWSHGTAWDGLHLKKDQEIRYWKRKLETDEI